MRTIDRSALLSKGGGYLCCLLVLIVGWFAANRGEQPSKAQETAGVRENLAFHYLSITLHDADNIETLAKWLARIEESTDQDGVREVIALIYGLEGMETEAKEVLDKMQQTDGVAIMKYALEYDSRLPDDWETTLGNDWVGARLATLIHKRHNDEIAYAGSLVSLRLYESEAKRNSGIKALLQLMTYLGLGLMLSMAISGRQWRKLGRNFFFLEPLIIQPQYLWRFAGFFLLVFLAALAATQALAMIPGLPGWVGFSAFYLVLALGGSYLVSRQLFPKSGPPAHELLGMSNLKLHFSNIFQILGGLAVLLACYQLAAVFMLSVGWPLNSDSEQLEQFRTIMDSPLSASIFVMTACVAAPIFEEVIFRGILMRGMMSTIKTSQAVLISAVFFAVLHGVESVPIYLGLGLGLGLIYYRTGNILINIWAHALWNFLILALTTAGIHLG